MNMAWVLGLVLALLLLILISILYVYKKRRIYTHQRRLSQIDETRTIGFFHPYANGGGGGERVLYCAILALVRESQRKHTKLRILLYTGDDQLNVSALITRAAERFNLPELQSLHVDTLIRLILLPNRNLLEPSQYPRFTLFWQSIAHIRLAITGFRASEHLGLYPQVWIDTTGCPFAYIIAHVLYTCSVVTYVHYPMISTDMIDKVVSRQSDYNNPSHIASSLGRSYIKLIYYKLFAWIYGYVGRMCTDVVMVNSTWTYHHITRLWGRTTLPMILYPPCGNINQFATFSINQRQPLIISISQFRPEKNQLLQLQAFSQFFQTYRDKTSLKLVLVGSCRNQEDEERVKVLREQCAELNLMDHVEFIVNAPFSKLQELLATASMGIHTMHNEHFGISIVEMMAAGLIVIANNSGGPAADILETKESHRNGFLASTAQEYAQAMIQILNMSPSETIAVRKRAQTASFRYSDETFEQQWCSMMQPALQ